MRNSSSSNVDSKHNPHIWNELWSVWEKIRAPKRQNFVLANGQSCQCSNISSAILFVATAKICTVSEKHLNKVLFPFSSYAYWKLSTVFKSCRFAFTHWKGNTKQTRSYFRVIWFQRGCANEKRWLNSIRNAKGWDSISIGPYCHENQSEWVGNNHCVVSSTHVYAVHRLECVWE